MHTKSCGLWRRFSLLIAGADDMFMRGFGAEFTEALPGPASRRSMPDTSAFAYR